MARYRHVRPTLLCVRPEPSARKDDVMSTAMQVTGGVDTHADTHHAAALDEVGRLLGDREFPATPAGYAELGSWLAGYGELAVVGVEGTGCYGAGLTRHLRAEGATVLEVNRPDRRQRVVRGKSDPLDAENAARRALARRDTAIPKDTATAVESVRALTVARAGAIKARTAALNQLKDLRLTAPEPLRSALRAGGLRQLAQAAARLRPDPTRLAEPTQATKAAMRSVGRRVQILTDEINDLDRQITALVAQIAPATLSLFAVSTHHAAQLVITAGANPDRLHSEAAFAALCGASPIPASSGKSHRHRLNRAGDRHANRTLHMITVLRMRWHPATRAYVQRRTAEGMTKLEIMRCLKRYIARETYHALISDLTTSQRLDAV